MEFIYIIFTLKFFLRALLNVKVEYLLSLETCLFLLCEEIEFDLREYDPLF